MNSANKKLKERENGILPNFQSIQLTRNQEELTLNKTRI